MDAGNDAHTDNYLVREALKSPPPLGVWTHAHTDNFLVINALKSPPPLTHLVIGDDVPGNWGGEQVGKQEGKTCSNRRRAELRTEFHYERSRDCTSLVWLHEICLTTGVKKNWHQVSPRTAWLLIPDKGLQQTPSCRRVLRPVSKPHLYLKKRKSFFQTIVFYKTHVLCKTLWWYKNLQSIKRRPEGIFVMRATHRWPPTKGQDR